MKILQVAPYFHPHLGGVESHVRDLSDHLARRGHDVTVLTSRFDDSPTREKMDGYDVVRLAPLGVLFSTPVTPALTNYIRKGKWDIVHTHWPPPLDSFFAARARCVGGPPHVLTYHCDLELKMPLGRYAVSFYNATLGDRAFSAMDAIIVTTKGYGATSRSVWNKKTYVIPNAVDAVRFNPGNDGAAVRKRHRIGKSPLLLYVGRLVHHKGIEHLVESLQHLPADVRLMIVGIGPFRDYFRKRAMECSVYDRVTFAGRVPTLDLPNYYAAGDIFVLPSVSRLEAFGIVALEAMATGKPVLVSNIPGVNEVIEDGVQGLVFEPMNPVDLASKVSVLLGDPSGTAMMGASGRERVLGRFRIRHIAEQAEQAYIETIGRVP